MLPEQHQQQTDKDNSLLVRKVERLAAEEPDFCYFAVELVETKAE